MILFLRILNVLDIQISLRKDSLDTQDFTESVISNGIRKQLESLYNRIV